MSHLLLQILADLVVYLQFLFDLFELVFVKVGIFFDWRGRSEEVEERFGGLGLSDKTGAVGV